MEITQKSIGQGKVELTISIPVADVAKAEETAFRKLQLNLKVKGFRKGKVPDSIAREQVTLADIRSKAIEDNLGKWYIEAIDKQGLKVITNPELQITEAAEDKPLVFTAIISVYPEVTIGDYKAIKVKHRAVKVEAADLTTALDNLRQEQVRYEDKDKAVADGDVAVMDIGAKLDGEVVKAFTRSGYELYIGDGYFAPGFDDQIKGLSKGDDKTFTLHMPADYPLERFRDKDLVFTVKMLGTKVRVMPELNDEFAQKLQAKDVADLQEKVKESLVKMRTEQTERDFQTEVLEATAKLAGEFEVPHVLIEEEVHKMEHEFEWRLKQQGFSLSQFLETKKQSMEDLHKEWHPHAEKVSRQDMIIDQISVIEKIQASEAEVQNEIVAWLQPYRDNQGKLTQKGKDSLRSLMSENGQLYMRQLIRREKTRRLLYEIATQNAAPKTTDKKAEPVSETTAEIAKPKAPHKSTKADKKDNS